MDVLLVMSNIWLPSFLSNVSDKNSLPIPQYALTQEHQQAYKRKESKIISDAIIQYGVHQSAKSPLSRTNSASSMKSGTSGSDYDPQEDTIIPDLNKSSIVSSFFRRKSSNTNHDYSTPSSHHSGRPSIDANDISKDTLTDKSDQLQTITYGRGGIKVKQHLMSPKTSIPNASIVSPTANRVYGRGSAPQSQRGSMPDTSLPTQSINLNNLPQEEKDPSLNSVQRITLT